MKLQGVERAELKAMQMTPGKNLRAIAALPGCDPELKSDIERKLSKVGGRTLYDEARDVAPEANKRGSQWRAGDAPSQVLDWAVKSLAKAGTLSIVGLYPEGRLFPIGEARDKNLTIKAGNTPHRKYIPELIELVEAGVIDPSEVLTQTEPLEDAIEAYKAFDKRESGWVKVELRPEPEKRKAA